MKHYEPGTPHAVLGLAALAVTAIAVGLLVLVPSNVESNGPSPGPTETRQVVSAAQAAAAARPSHTHGARDHA